MSRQTFPECVNFGMKDAATNGKVGGRYTPATATSAGFFATTLGIINPAYRDRAGKLQREPEAVYVTIFNNSRPGTTQWADVYAKYLPVGKQLKNVIVDRKQYMTQAKGASGELLVKPDGTPFLIQKESYTLIHAELGKDSGKLLNEEINAWINGKGELNFNSRPPFWNGCPDFLIAMGRVTLQEATDGKKLWEQVSKARAATVYQPGMTMFGYAKVVVKGAPLAQPVTTVYQPIAGNIPGFTPIPAAAPNMATFANTTMPSSPAATPPMAATAPAAPIEEGAHLGDPIAEM